MRMRVCLHHPAALIPTRAHETDAGLDLYTHHDVYIEAHGDITINTGVRIAIPDGYAGIVKEKSGRAVMDKITIGACVIDSGYRGDLIVHLFNNSQRQVYFKSATAIAQLVVVPIYLPELEVVTLLDDTPRGAGGFGSSGVEHKDSNEGV